MQEWGCEWSSSRCIERIGDNAVDMGEHRIPRDR
jgi:hypothetical protein